jgi:hypothetical protein
MLSPLEAVTEGMRVRTLEDRGGSPPAGERVGAGR